MRPLAVCIALLASASTLATADTPCPVSCTYNNTTGAHCSTAASHDSSSSESCYPYPGSVSSHVEYDLVYGTVRATAGSCGLAGSGQASVYAKDRYHLVGPPGGGSMAFQAQVAAYGAAGAFGSVGVSIAETGGSIASVNEGNVGGFNQALVLNLSHAVGEEFVLELSAYASADQTADARGTLSFTAPPDYGVASCQGFAGDGAVPTRAASWGSLKLRYR